MARTVIAAGVLAVSLFAAMPGTAAACQVAFLPPVEEAVAEYPVIFMGRVVEIPVDRTYVIEVSRVFRGEVPGTTTLAEPPGEPTSSCDAIPRIGRTYLFAMDSLDQGYLGVGNLPVQIRGARLEGSFVDTHGLDLAGLIALLEGLPDASMAPRAGTGSPIQAIGAALLLLGLIMAARPRAVRYA